MRGTGPAVVRLVLPISRPGGIGIIEFNGFVDQHNRDIIYDLIKQPTFFTDQSGAVFIELNSSFALRAGKYFQ
jgi:hypothetical protein